MWTDRSLSRPAVGGSFRHADGLHQAGFAGGRSLIGQYLRHPEVARDFAAYWELYKKYRQDYGVEDILQGRPFAAVLERAQKAAFDERISLVSLLLAG